MEGWLYLLGFLGALWIIMEGE
jgi:hypothetical protein